MLLSRLLLAAICTCIIHHASFVRAEDAALRGQRAKAVATLAPEGGEPRFFFLGIGISRYSNWPTLRTPVRDVEAVAELLKTRYLFDAEHMVLLLDASATKAGISQAFQDLRARVRDEDSVLIYYAGHGARNEDELGYWIPVDGNAKDETTWILNEQTKTEIRQLKRARHVLLVSDSCFAGDFFGERGSLSDMPAEMRKAYDRVSRTALVSGGNEPVMDLGISEEHSVFADFFLRVLNDNKRRYLRISSSSFLGYIQAGLKDNAEQRPSYGALLRTGGAEGGDFVFFLEKGYIDSGSDVIDEPVGTQDQTVPVNCNALLFSGPGDGILIVAGRTNDLSARPLIHLPVGRYPFSLDTPGNPRIYGVFTVHVVDELTRLTQYGGKDDPLFRQKHVAGALEGQPVTHEFRTSGPDGPVRVMSYVMSLNKIQ